MCHCCLSVSPVSLVCEGSSPCSHRLCLSMPVRWREVRVLLHVPKKMGVYMTANRMRCQLAQSENLSMKLGTANVALEYLGSAGLLAVCLHDTARDTAQLSEETFYSGVQ